MDGLKRQIRYQLFDAKKSFIMFWSIIIVVDIFLYYFNMRFGVQIGMMNHNGAGHDIHLSVVGSNIISIFIYIIVYNMIMYYESFPISISFSTTRKDFYAGAVIHNIILCLAMAAVQAVLFKIDTLIVSAIGVKPIEYFVNMNLVRDSVFYITIMLFILFIICSALFNLLGALSYRLGYMMWIVLGVLFILLMIYGPDQTVVGRVLSFIFKDNNSFIYSIKLILTSSVLYTFAWMIIRRMSIKNMKVNI